MRRLLFSLLMFCVFPARADRHDQLYKVAGWAEQRAHFNDAISAAQQRYRNSLPPAVYQALVDNSKRRFAPQAMDQRALDSLRTRPLQRERRAGEVGAGEIPAFIRMHHQFPPGYAACPRLVAVDDQAGGGVA